MTQRFNLERVPDFTPPRDGGEALRQLQDSIRTTQRNFQRIERELLRGILDGGLVPPAGLTMGGDVTGSTLASIVERIRGNAIANPGATEDEKLLRYADGTESLDWKTIAELLEALLTASGDIAFRGASTVERLAKGSDGEVLTLASGLPSWAPGSSGERGKFRFTYLFTDGYFMEGTCDGVVSGNTVTELSNIYIIFDGLNANRPPFSGDRGDGTSFGFLEGGAVISFDGLENDFAFSDGTWPDFDDFTQVWYDIADSGTGFRNAWANEEVIDIQKWHDDDGPNNTLPGVWTLERIADSLPPVDFDLLSDEDGLILDDGHVIWIT